uniref:Uncharacterized protein n=1 Tax=Hyaloperonospora arabidopsidis (strain Emoy2) TaxID=559515 RepID=M4C1H1_HYAAE
MSRRSQTPGKVRGRNVWEMFRKWRQGLQSDKFFRLRQEKKQQYPESKCWRTKHDICVKI